MIRQYVTAYFLGAITFWPLLGLSVFVTFKVLRPLRPPPRSDSEEQEKEEKEKNGFATLNQLPLQNMARFDPMGKYGTLDLENDIEASMWIRLSPSFIALSDSYESGAETQSSPKQTKPPAYTAKSSLQKFMSPAQSGQSSAGSIATPDSTTRSSASSINGDSVKPKSISKCPRYWGVVRGAQLQLFEDKTERKLLDIFALPQFIVSLWPQNLQEYELFYRRYPIVLLSRTDPEGLVSLDLYPNLPPRDAVYLYIENSVEKEDMYFALIEASKAASGDSYETQGLSLGPRDPVRMAQPVRVKKAEAQQLQSAIWNNDLPLDTQWLNALLGRIFLALKDSKLAEDYLTRKFSTKLKPISGSSNIIGDILVKQINSGSAAPHFSNIRLKELTPDGNLVLGASVSYNGGFKVNLGTSVKLAAVTSLTTVEIPVELAATLRQLRGEIVLRVKPAPSERIWYAFESMPDVDLQIEPAVYDTHISLSMVTKFIRSKILDSLRESLVMPYMDDLCFYDTSDSFYRGGIWQPPSMEKDRPKSKPRKDAEAEPVLAPRIRKGVTTMESDDAASVNSVSTVSSTTAVQRFSNWMRKKRTPDPALSPKPMRRERASSTTHVTTDPALPVPETDSLAPATQATTTSTLSPAASPVKLVKRKPVPSETTQPEAKEAYRKPVPDETTEAKEAFELKSGSLLAPVSSPSLAPAPSPSLGPVLSPPKSPSTSPSLGSSLGPTFAPVTASLVSTPSLNTSTEPIEGFIAGESRRNSMSSLRSRQSSQPGSIRSNGSNPGPMLPPRRRVVPLSNIAPERDES